MSTSPKWVRDNIQINVQSIKRIGTVELEKNLLVLEMDNQSMKPLAEIAEKYGDHDNAAITRVNNNDKMIAAIEAELEARINDSAP